MLLIQMNLVYTLLLYVAILHYCALITTRPHPDQARSYLTYIFSYDHALTVPDGVPSGAHKSVSPDNKKKNFATLWACRLFGLVQACTSTGK
jgi:hypothetical protein